MKDFLTQNGSIQASQEVAAPLCEGQVAWKTSFAVE